MSESIRFCGMHYPVRMFGRRVNGEEFQSFSASVNKIMLRSCGHRKHIASSNSMRFASHYGSARTSDKDQDLVNSFVDFLANVLSRRNAHQNHLRMFVREQDFPKVIVL